MRKRTGERPRIRRKKADDKAAARRESISVGAGQKATAPEGPFLEKKALREGGGRPQ